MKMVNYMRWLDEANLLVQQTYDENVKELIEQISWILNLTNIDKAQEIFNYWYGEMIEDTEYEFIFEKK